MGYGDFCLLVSIRDASANGEISVTDLISDFPESMIATAIRQKTIDASDCGMLRLTEIGRQAIEQFHVSKSAQWGWTATFSQNQN